MKQQSWKSGDVLIKEQEIPTGCEEGKVDGSHKHRTFTQGAAVGSDGKVKLHEALVVSVESSRWSSLFNKGLKAH